MTTVEQLNAEIALLKSELEASVKLVAALRADLQSMAKAAKPKRRNPILRLCESSSEEVEPVKSPKPGAIAALTRKEKRLRLQTSVGRIVVDDLASPKWEWSDEYDNTRSKTKWTVYKQP
jgi:hypothetical protein